MWRLAIAGHVTGLSGVRPSRLREHFETTGFVFTLAFFLPPKKWEEDGALCAGELEHAKDACILLKLRIDCGCCNSAIRVKERRLCQFYETISETGSHLQGVD